MKSRPLYNHTGGRTKIGLKLHEEVGSLMDQIVGLWPPDTDAHHFELLITEVAGFKMAMRRLDEQALAAKIKQDRTKGRR